MRRTAGAELPDKVAMVTAASEGLGYACALRLAEAGCRVAICGRRASVLDAARAEIERRARAEVCAVPTDLVRPDQIEGFVRQAIDRFQRVDILVVNTGHIPYGSLDDLREEDWYAAFELITMSAVRLVRLVTPLMRGHGSGDIVFITSAVVKEPVPHLLLSNVMRAGVTALAKSLSRDLAPSNIRVNCVAPGYFDTGRVRRRVDEITQRDGVAREVAARIVAGDVPVGRMGDPQELAELVFFLATRRAGFLTGATVQIDGGSSRGLF